jgi:hypothetical protein
LLSVVDSKLVLNKHPNAVSQPDYFRETKNMNQSNKTITGFLLLWEVGFGSQPISTSNEPLDG